MLPPLPFSPVQFQYICYYAKETKSNEVFLISANNGNKRRDLMRYKILDIEVYLPLHKWRRTKKGLRLT